MARKKQKFHYIYMITNTKNGNYYIGMHSTNNLEDGYMGGGTRIRNSIRKHGLEVHTKNIIEFLDDRESLKKREREIVNESLIQDKKCLNLQLGGGGGFINNEHMKKAATSGASKTNQMRRENPESWIKACEGNGEKISKKLKEIYSSGHFNPWSGKKHKQETKNKISEKNSESQKGGKNSQFNTCWIHNLENKINKKIKKEEVEKYIERGWTKGRKMKF